jgi:uncharacterized protein YciI
MATMPYMIQFDDAEGVQERRLELRDAHRAHVRSQGPKVLASGGLLDDDIDRADGGLILIDFDTRAEAEAFVQADPFFRGGIYTDVQIRRWRKAFFDGKSCV